MSGGAHVAWVGVLVSFAVAACPTPRRTASDSAPDAAPAAPRGGTTMMFVEIDGTLEELRGLLKIKGLQLQGGAHDLGGGLRRAVGTVTDRAALDEVRARGLTVHITMDEDEVRRRYEEKDRLMRDAVRDGGLVQEPKKDDPRQQPPKKP